MMPTATTRKRILDAALHLFNASGTAAVSTNHIAAAAGISPGNLYYHYRNKQEIIRALVEELLAAFEELWTRPRVQPLRPEDLQEAAHTAFELQWQYRFYGREVVALSRTDPLLGQRLQENYHRRRRQQRAFIQQLIDADVLRAPATEAELDQVLAARWIINEFWLAFLESTGQPVTHEQFQAGSQVVARIFQPYLLERPE
jgi:AcrR family transcriptional regulator